MLSAIALVSLAPIPGFTWREIAWRIIDPIVALIAAHPGWALFTVALWAVMSAIASALPSPSPTSSWRYTFVFNLLHIAAMSPGRIWNWFRFGRGTVSQPPMPSPPQGTMK
jgi:hypothetical protein